MATRKKKSGYERRKEKARDNEFFSKMPDYIREPASGNLSDFAFSLKDLPPEFRLKGGLKTGDENGGIVIATDAMKKNANSANEERSDAALQKAIALKNLYPQHWGKRADIIARESGKSERTIRRYFSRLK